MQARKATVSILYNGVNATAQIAGYLGSFRYRDMASGESDSISISLNDRDHKWIGPWFPARGDKLQVGIQTENWRSDGQRQTFPCGTFGVDDFSFSGGPISLTLEALALPANSDFKAQERTETYEKTTVKEIGQKIAERTGIELYFDAEDTSIEKVEQNNQTDCAFYNDLAEKYGLSLKVCKDRLVVFSEAAYEDRDPKLVLTPADFDPSWSWNMSTTGTYTGVFYQYTNSEKNKTFTVKAGTEGRILTVNDPADNLTEATAIALAKLNAANRGAVTMSISMMAHPGLIASDVVQIKGLKNLDGKYYIESITHTIGSGYKMALALRRVEQRITEATSVATDVAAETAGGKAPGTPATTSSIVGDTAVQLAWPEGTPVKTESASGTEAYLAASKRVWDDGKGGSLVGRGGDYAVGRSCDVFAATVIRASGADPEILPSNPNVIKRLKSNSSFVVINNTGDISCLKHGDVLYRNGHWKIIVEIDGEIKAAEAAYQYHTGRITNTASDLRGYTIYRYTG